MRLTAADHEAHERSSPFESRAQDRAAAIVFAVAVVVAVPTILYLNRRQWFFLDEWDFLAGRDIRSAHDLIRPHNEHWTTIPIVLYRLVFRVVGLNHYWPYQLLAITAHLSAAALLRVVMRRAGVNAWLATAAAILFAYFGTGREDFAWGFQVTFSGSLAFGLAAIVLSRPPDPIVDHRRFGRRDLGAIACGLGALMCSGIGVSMVVALGVTVLLARGWRLAAIYVTPLAATYLAWFLAYGRQALPANHGTVHTATELVWSIIRATFAGLGQVPGIGILLAAVLIVGTFLTITKSSLTELRHRYSAPGGLLVSAATYLVITGYGRSLFKTEAASRYQHLLAAMVLPAIVVAASAITTRWRYALPVLVALLLVGLPGNIAKIRPRGNEVLTLGNPRLVLNTASLARSSKLPRSYHPLPQGNAQVTIGWLRDQAALGRIPAPPTAPLVRRQAKFLLSLQQLTKQPSTTCQTQTLEPIQLSPGDVVSVPSFTAVSLVRTAANGPPDRATFSPIHGQVVVRALVADLTVQISAQGRPGPTSVCRADR